MQLQLLKFSPKTPETTFLQVKIVGTFNCAKQAAQTAAGELVEPVPLRTTVSGLLLASVVKMIDAGFEPTDVGAKATVTVQLNEAERVEPQVLERTVYWPGFAPPGRIEVMFSVAVPELVRTIPCPAEVVLIGTLPKASVPGAPV